jgi:dolichol-phosphate mannosyltransferase
VTETAGAKVVVVMPARNAARTLEQTYSAIPKEWVDEIILVDDKSTDETIDVARGLPIHTIWHPHNVGYGGNQKTCYLEALQQGADVVVMLHPDGQYPATLIPDLVKPIAAGDADVVLGSRYVPGGATVGWAGHRRLLSRAGNVYSRRVLSLPLHDVTGGYRCFRRTALAELGTETVASEGYCFQVDVAFRVQRAGLRVREVPITFVEREQGESKMSGAVVREALWRITSWGLRDRLRRRRARPRRG